jgi:Regulator of chromosome condensation (RCC1) repeat
MDWLNAAELKQAACGPTHTLLLTDSGKVYSCGSNDYGQLGQENARKRPRTSSFSMWQSSFILLFYEIMIFLLIFFCHSLHFLSHRKCMPSFEIFILLHHKFWYLFWLRN